MTLSEFKRVYRLADLLLGHEMSLGESGEYEQAQEGLIGFGLGRKYATARQAAIIYNAQTLFFSGVRDALAMESTRADMLRNVTLID